MSFRLLLVGLFLSAGCAHTRDDEMTAAEHRNEAAIHTARARDEQARADPLQTQAAAAHNPAAASAGEEWNRTYAPTASHLEAADRELLKASEHLRAAKRLEAFEEATCRAIPKAERAACPLLASSVATVHETTEGLALVLKPAVDAVETHRRLACHLAYAEAEGFARPSCPLFLKGVKLALTQDETGRAIRFTATEPQVAGELKEQARRLFLASSITTR